MISVEERSDFARQHLMYLNKSRRLFNTLSLAMEEVSRPTKYMLVTYLYYFIFVNIHVYYLIYDAGIGGK